MEPLNKKSKQSKQLLFVRNFGRDFSQGLCSAEPLIFQGFALLFCGEPIVSPHDLGCHKLKG